jgi:hypothetical protein
MGYIPVCRARRADSRGMFRFSQQSFIRAEYYSKYQNFNIVQGVTKSLRPPLQLKVQMISQSILYQIKAHEKLHLWV